MRLSTILWIASLIAFVVVGENFGWGQSFFGVFWYYFGCFCGGMKILEDNAGERKC